MKKKLGLLLPWNYKRTPVTAHDDRMHNYISSGMYYGFPVCCILEFAYGNNETRTDFIEGTFPLCCTGYVPCPKCSKLGESELIATIEKNRSCQGSFPGIHNDDRHYKRILNRWNRNGIPEAYKVLEPLLKLHVIKITKLLEVVS